MADEEQPLEFKLEEAELTAARAFQQGHQCPDHADLWSFEFHPAGLGVAVWVRCLTCGQAENVTDYDCW